MPATIITLQKDSLPGYIDYRNWNITPTEIRFRTAPNAPIQTFRPPAISGFRISSTNELYLSKWLKLDITPHTMDYLSNHTERVYQQDTVFAMQLVQGSLSLYSFTDEHNREHYFYDGADRQPEELKVIKQMINAHAVGTSLQTMDYYHEQLDLLFNDCQEVRKRTAAVSYTEKSLSNIFLRYNNCKGSEAATRTIVQASTKNKVHFGIQAGFSQNNIRFKGNHPLVADGYKNGSSPLLGVWLDVPFSRGVRDFSLHTGLTYKSVKTEWQGTPASGRYTERKFDLSYIQLDLLFRYTYPKGKWHPFVNVGVAGAAAWNAKTEQKVVYSSTDTEIKEAIEGPRRLEQSLIFGAGLEYSRFQLELRHARSNGFSSYNSLKISVASYQAMLKYRLF
ncbi:hypothetical protein CK934_07810 [Chitinophaga sp. MD30]|nr:hypothetical protein CK934_07810 [Chitinophaga sp. MD30]